jgi:hypothetical protein
MTDSTSDDWLAGLSEFDRLRAQRLRLQADQLGRIDTDEWVAEEVEDDHAQPTRLLVVHHLWDRAITAREKPGELERLPAAQRLLAAGGQLQDIVQVMRVAAHEASLSTLLTIDEGADDEAPGGSMGWRLMEVDPDGRFTGRDLDGLSDELHDLLQRDGLWREDDEGDAW